MNPMTGNLGWKRSKVAEANDTFRTFPFPVPAANRSTNKLIRGFFRQRDIFSKRSTDRGTNWTAIQRVNLDAKADDQWMPVLCVKPDGTQLFMGWCDRRNDTNNSLIEVYARFGTIGTNGTVEFGTDFKISSANFPPVFAGTLTNNMEAGHYDPVYPTQGVNLSWHYAEYPDDPAVVTNSQYRSHVGEYNGAWADAQGVYVSWTDYRLQSIGTIYGRHQSDVRFVRLTWPQ